MIGTDGDVAVFEGISVLDYLKQWHGYGEGDAEDFGVVDADRCTTIIEEKGLRLRCCFAGVDRWVSNGVVVWNRCRDCLRERAFFSESFSNKGKGENLVLNGRVIIYGDTGRFRKE